MNTMNRFLIIAGIAVALGAGTGKLRAQGGGGFQGGGGGFDMSQMMKLMVDNMREPMEVTDDSEWTVISEKIQKVMDARMQSGLGGSMGMFSMLGRGGRGGGGAAGQGGGRGGMGALFGSNPEGEALQKVIDAKASNSELKAALEKFVEARKKKQTALEKAQADLRKLLSVRQEAIAFSMGLL